MVFKKGYKPTEEHKRKLSIAKQKAIKEGTFISPVRQSPDIKKQISKQLKGKKHPKQRRENISIGVKKAYQNGRVKNHFKKVTNAEITKRVMFKGKRIPISHKVWFENTEYIPIKGEVVHHKDFDKYNNNFANLQLMTISEHIKLHWRIEYDID